MKKSHYLTPDWPAPPHVKAFTTLRCEGQSQPPFDSFNLSTREPSDPTDALLNRRQLKEELSLKNEPVWISQVHGTRAIPAEAFYPSQPEADASYTNKPNVSCVVLTADCLPILICNKSGTEVAAIHAGWRGLQAGVIEATLQKLQTSLFDCLAWLGPGIGPTAFEVGQDVYDLFVQADIRTEKAFKAFKPDKWLCDAYMIARQQLIGLGVTNIYGGEYCTYSDAENFYSFRRDCVTGRMASLIWIDGLSHPDLSTATSA